MRTAIAPLVGIPLAIVTLDQITKHWVLTQMSLYESVPVLPGFFHLTSVRNPGAAFGFLASYGPVFRGVVLIGVSILAVVLLTVFYLKSAPHERGARVAAALVIGGAVGNLIDRIRFGEVVDFLDVFIGRYHWPAFNVADSAITIGIGLFLWSSWHLRDLAPQPETADPKSGTAHPDHTP